MYAYAALTVYPNSTHNIHMSVAKRFSAASVCGGLRCVSAAVHAVS